MFILLIHELILYSDIKAENALSRHVLSSRLPMISVSQCAPESILPTTVAAIRITQIIFNTLHHTGFLIYFPISIIALPMTVSDNTVCEDGNAGATSNSPGIIIGL